MPIKNSLWNPNPDDFTSLLEDSPNGIFIIDENGRLVAVNKAYEIINDLQAEDILGNNLYELVEKGFIETSIGLLVMKSHKMESIIQRIPKTNKELLVIANPIFDNEHQLKFVIGVSLDLGLLSEVQWELWMASKQLNVNLDPHVFIAESDYMKNVLMLSFRVAQSKTSVLIQGESGVGKDVLAHYIHDNSVNKSGNFVSLNCAAFPPELLESELFGYDEGAFTGAKRGGKPGLMEMAKDGTLFLDEIGDLPLSLQPKLLRVLEERKLRRLGSVKEIPSNFRLVSATNKNLKELVLKHEFREDLYFRLAIVPILIPPLRKRREDIVALANYFLKKINEEYHTNRILTDETLQILKTKDWPGNARELKNYIERLVILTNTQTINPKDLLMDAQEDAYYEENNTVKLKDYLQHMEQELVLQTYERLQSTRKAAEQLGVSQSQFMRKLQKYRYNNES